MSNLLKNSGQNIIEYAVILSIVVAGLTGMQYYLRRGIQATIKVAADEMGDQEDSLTTDPIKGQTTDSDTKLISSSSRTTESKQGGKQEIDFSSSSTVTGTSEYESSQ